MRWPSILIAAAAIALLLNLTGCGEETPPPAPAPPPKKVAPAPPEPGVVDAVQEEEKEAPPRYVYDSTGRRDPFDIPLNVKKSAPRVGMPLTPLQRFDLGQLRLIGVIVGKGEPRAMVVAPDGKSYILKKGIKVGRNDGKVVDVRPEAVLVEERYYDFTGTVRKGVQKIQLPEREGVL
ncbi:MAG: hypothetical protein C0617_03420 [Desulfuromonas sp.]|uniref:pilus assembly protein PilP n=1 Tax=Desulfuromonas sp. TaxID=892 RepID=UPI000CC70933|nr:pilus assembly protein PilP [Desulfuromonas sp.]PLX85740.1 MAG: hypothetical protein C0617_03420 [Desulfuromonas sp.]